MALLEVSQRRCSLEEKEHFTMTYKCIQPSPADQRDVAQHSNDSLDLTKLGGRERPHLGHESWGYQKIRALCPCPT